MKIAFFRHGATHLNYEQRLQGISDPPLAPDGAIGVRESARTLPRMAYERIYASPLRRAQQTAELVSKHLDIPVQVDDRLIERSLGRYEGITRHDAVRQARAVGDNPLDADYRPPEGESINDVIPRVESFLAEIKQRDAPVVVIVHGAWLQALASTGMVENQDLDNAEFNVAEI